MRLEKVNEVFGLDHKASPSECGLVTDEVKLNTLRWFIYVVNARWSVCRQGVWE